MRNLVIGAAALAGVFGLGAVASVASANGGGGGGNLSSTPSTSSRDNPQQAYQAGVAALREQNFLEAIRQFRRARRAAPNDGAINFALGLAYAGNNESEDARDAFERAVAAENAPAGAFLQLGVVSLELGQRDAALAQQARLVELLTECDASCGNARRAQLQAAHDQLTQALDAASEAPATADPATTGWNFPSDEQGRLAYAEAVGLINQERFPAALDALARAEAAVGPHPDILNYMGFASRKLGRFDAALNYYHAALRLNPHHLGATEYLGELYIQMGEMGRARTQLAQLDILCAYGCAQREELARWIERASE